MDFYNPYGGFYGQPYGAFNNNIGNLPQFPNYTPNNQNYQVNSQQSQNTAQNQNNGLRFIKLNKKQGASLWRR